MQRWMEYSLDSSDFFYFVLPFRLFMMSLPCRDCSGFVFSLLVRCVGPLSILFFICVIDCVSAKLNCKCTKLGGNWSDSAIAQRKHRIKQVRSSIVPRAGILVTSVKWLVAANLQILPWIESSISIRLTDFFATLAKVGKP